jgi:ABC-type glycerol-3-phosphate transport system substrate-binding protein
MSTIARKSILIAAAAAIALAAIAFALFILPGLRPTVIAYYGVDGPSVEAIKSLSTRDGQGVEPLEGLAGLEHVILDPSKPLDEYFERGVAIDLLVTHDGMALASIAERFAEPSAQALRRLPSSLRALGSTRSKRYGVALQADTLELAYSRAAFAAKALDEPRSLEGLVAAMRALTSREGFPLLVAGGSDDDLLLLVSSLVEMRGGPTASEALRGIIAQDGVTEASFSKALDAELPSSGGASFKLSDALKELGSWRREGLVHPEWLAFKERDLLAAIENGYAPLVVMRLSTHRAVSLRRVAQYEAISLPYSSASFRHSALALMGAVNARSPAPKVHAAELALEILTGEEAQRRVSWATGLVPSNAAIEALDKQAADARLWLAASGGALVDIGRAALADPGQRAALARAIRDALKGM